MAPPKKKRKLSKRAKKKLFEEKSKKALEKRGLGTGSRRNFALGVNWKEEEYQSGDRTRVQYVSPGKTKYKTQKSAGEALAARNLGGCFYDKASSSEEESADEDSEYNPSSEEDKDHKETLRKAKGLKMNRRFFVCESTQLTDFVEQINATTNCSTDGCNGE